MTVIDIKQFASVDDEQLNRLLERLEPHRWPEGLNEGRAFYDGWGPPIPQDVNCPTARMGGVRVVEVIPPVAREGRVGIWFHGGAYIQGSHASHGAMVAELARESRCRFIHPQYRLAPEHPFPAAVIDGVAVYQTLLRQGQDAAKIIVGGDSAGGGLALATLLRSRHIGLPMPDSLVLFSPWTDLTCTGETLSTNDGTDPLVTRQACQDFASAYLAGADPRAWEASPLWADLTGLPRTLIQVGEREVLFSDSRRLHDRLVSHGVDVTLEVWASQIHVWQLHQDSLRQARQAVGRVGEFTRTGLLRG